MMLKKSKVKSRKKEKKEGNNSSVHRTNFHHRYMHFKDIFVSLVATILVCCLILSYLMQSTTLNPLQYRTMVLEFLANGSGSVGSTPSENIGDIPSSTTIAMKKKKNDFEEFVDHHVVDGNSKNEKGKGGKKKGEGIDHPTRTASKHPSQQYGKTAETAQEGGQPSFDINLCTASHLGVSPHYHPAVKKQKQENTETDKEQEDTNNEQVRLHQLLRRKIRQNAKQFSLHDNKKEGRGSKRDLSSLPRVELQTFSLLPSLSSSKSATNESTTDSKDIATSVTVLWMEQPESPREDLFADFIVGLGESLELLDDQRQQKGEKENGGGEGFILIDAASSSSSLEKQGKEEGTGPAEVTKKKLLHKNLADLMDAVAENLHAAVAENFTNIQKQQQNSNEKERSDSSATPVFLQNSGADHHVLPRYRVLVGQQIFRTSRGLSCTVLSQTHFNTVLPYVSFPILMSRDIAEFFVYFAQDFLISFEKEKSEGQMMSGGNKNIKEEVPEEKSKKDRKSVKKHLQKLPLDVLIGLLLAGRDIHLLSWRDWTQLAQTRIKHLQQKILLDSVKTHHQLASLFYIPSWSAETEYPFNISTMIDIETESIGALIENGEERKGDRNEKKGEGQKTTKYAVETIFSATSSFGETPEERKKRSTSHQRVNVNRWSFPFRSAEGPLENENKKRSDEDSSGWKLFVMYIPAPIDRLTLRESTRCFYNSLLPSSISSSTSDFSSLKEKIYSVSALHFVIGARKTSTGYISNLKLFEALARENGTSTSGGNEKMMVRGQKTTSTSGGDLLLFDFVDMDQDNGPSGSFLKVLLGVYHAFHYYPKFEFFIRGADDAYHNVIQLYQDLMHLYMQRITRKSAGRSSNNNMNISSPSATSSHSRNEKDEGRGTDAADHHHDAPLYFPHRMYHGHIVKRAMAYHKKYKHVDNALFVTSSRNIAPVMTTFYATGGGSIYSSDVMHYFTFSHRYFLPLLTWMEEDTNIGLTLSPFVSPVDDFRIHDFFNATSKIDFAYGGNVPHILDYCHGEDWIVHKYPWDALSRVHPDTYRLYCTEEEFVHQRSKSKLIQKEGERAKKGQETPPHHHCSKYLLSHFPAPKRNLASPGYFKLRKKIGTRRRPAAVAGGSNACRPSEFAGWIKAIGCQARQLSFSVDMCPV